MSAIQTEDRPDTGQSQHEKEEEEEEVEEDARCAREVDQVMCVVTAAASDSQTELSDSTAVFVSTFELTIRSFVK